MITFLRTLFSKQPEARNELVEQAAPEPSPVSVRYDDWGIYASLRGEDQSRIAWDEITLIAIRIEDEFLPFPYWYVGNQDTLLKIPNDAEGGKELFFDGFSEKIPGYKCNETFSAIIEASGAMEGSFILWKSAARRLG